MTNDLSCLRTCVRERLKALYQDRLRNVFLFGSYARGDQDPESDIDVLIVLDRVDDYDEEIDRTGELVSQLSLQGGITISRVFVSQSDWSRGATTFLREVRRESIEV